MIAELARNYGFKRTSLSLDLLLTLLGRQDVIRFPDPERSDMTGARCLDFLLLSKCFRVEMSFYVASLRRPIETRTGLASDR